MIEKAGYFARFECQERTHRVRKRVSQGGPGSIPWRDMEQDDYESRSVWVCYHVQRCKRCGKIVTHSNNDEAFFECPDRPAEGSAHE